MAYVTMAGGGYRSGPSIRLVGKIALIGAALAVASGLAAWTAGFNVADIGIDPSTSKSNALSTFADRFAMNSDTVAELSPRPLIRSLSSEIESKIEQAKSRLAQKLQAESWRSDLMYGASTIEGLRLDTSRNETARLDTLKSDPSKLDATKVAATTIPLPRARPPEAKYEVVQVASAVVPPVIAPPEPRGERTILQKLSDIANNIKLASLEPDGGGLSHDGPDLAALGYDGQTAVYDISAHAVYLPNGIKLEAHSGMGTLMDDVDHVNERMVGATPPAVYSLKPRERLFHGVEALRMTPEDPKATLGRSGLLTHSYMLGPNGDSNGCVSIKRYDNFLKSFKNGEFTRLVVVPNLNDAASAPQRTAATQSAS